MKVFECFEIILSDLWPAWIKEMYKDVFIGATRGGLSDPDVKVRAAAKKCNNLLANYFPTEVAPFRANKTTRTHKRSIEIQNSQIAIG